MGRTEAVHHRNHQMAKPPNYKGTAIARQQQATPAYDTNSRDDSESAPEREEECDPDMIGFEIVTG